MKLWYYCDASGKFSSQVPGVFSDIYEELVEGHVLLFFFFLPEFFGRGSGPSTSNDRKQFWQGVAGGHRRHTAETFCLASFWRRKGKNNILLVDMRLEGTLIPCAAVHSEALLCPCDSRCQSRDPLYPRPAFLPVIRSLASPVHALSPATPSATVCSAVFKRPKAPDDNAAEQHLTFD